MNFLDVRAVMFSHIVTDAVCTVVLVFLWLQNRKHFAGIAYWVLDFAFQTAAMVLVVLRGGIPDWISMTFSNTLVLAGALLGYMGLARFIGKKSRQIHNYILLAVFAAVHSYFVFVQPNLAARNLNVSLGLLMVCFQCVWLVLRRDQHGTRRIRQGVGLVFGGFCLVSLVRIIVILVSPHPSNDFFQSGLYDTLLLLSYQILLILLAFALVLMVNRRLLAEVKTQEEKFSKAFRSSPYAITLTRASDGQMLEVNEGFLNISGYAYAEAIGKTTLDLQLWANEADRVAVVSELSKGKRVVGREFQFRKKSGEILTGLFSAEIIKINGQPWVISSINDITERKRAEDEIRAVKAFLDSIINAIADPVFVKDDKRDFVLVNDALCTIVGRPREGLLGKDGDDMFPKEQVAVFRRMDASVLDTGKENLNEEFLSNLTSGEVRTIVTRKTRYIDPAGKHFLVGVIRDITERKQAEEQLKSQLEELQRWQEVMLDREDRVQELKREVNELCRRAGETARYPSQATGAAEAEIISK